MMATLKQNIEMEKYKLLRKWTWSEWAVVNGEISEEPKKNLYWQPLRVAKIEKNERKGNKREHKIFSTAGKPSSHDQSINFQLPTRIYSQSDEKMRQLFKALIKSSQSGVRERQKL